MSVDDDIAGEDLVLFSRPKHLDLQNPQLAFQLRQTGDREFAVTLSADTPALWAWLETTGEVEISLPGDIEDALRQEVKSNDEDPRRVTVRIRGDQREVWLVRDHNALQNAMWNRFMPPAPSDEDGEAVAGVLYLYPDPRTPLFRKPTAPGFPWQQRYVEWQPALLGLAHSPLFGLGLGNYQSAISTFYDAGPYRIPKPSTNYMEKGGNAFYAVWLFETGLVGLLALAWVLVTFFMSGIRGYGHLSAAGDNLLPALKVGACAALGAAVLGGMFTNYWVRGVGVAFAFVLALASFRPAGQTKE
jgi:hypothetical protein